MAIAVARSSGLYRSEMIECEGLEPLRQRRRRASQQQLPELHGHAAKDGHSAPREIEKAIRLRRLRRSAHIAIGMPSVA